jgi:hypothetical protein
MRRNASPFSRSRAGLAAYTGHGIAMRRFAMTPARLRWSYINNDSDLAGCFIIVAFGVVLCLFGSHLLSMELPYVFDGETAPGLVVGKWIAGGRQPAVASVLAHGGGRRGPNHSIQYQFTDADGQLRTGTASLNVAEWSALVPGSSLTIRYVRSDPGKNRPAGSNGLMWIAVGLTAGGAVALFCGLSLIAGRVRAINEQVRLTTTGRPVIGIIDSVERHNPRKGSAYRIVHYRYLAAGPSSEKVFQGQFRCCDRSSKKWRPGDPLVVLVDEGDPARHAPDRFHARPEDLATLRAAPPVEAANRH